ncbi:MAG: serine hydrolase domain-containing protein [Acidobacteriota bacterium]
MIKRTLIIVGLLFGLIPPVGPLRARGSSESEAPSALQDICEAAPCRNQIEERLRCYAPPPAHAAPGYALAILKNDEIFFRSVFGLANLQSEIPITIDTVFDLASLTKQFTAAGILMLMEDPNIKIKGNEGDERLSVGTFLSTIFPGFPASANITIGDLLTHQSGLPDYFELGKRELKKRHKFDVEKAFEKEGSPSWYQNFEHRRPALEVTNEQVLEMIKNAEPRRRKKPGTIFEYSNSGYVVLAQIIEKLSGKTYKQFMQEKIFNPLGMTNTTVLDESVDRTESERIAALHALPYGRHKNKYFLMDDYTPLNFVHGDGNIHSTLNDMIIWVKAIDKVVHGLPGALLKPSTLLEAFKPQPLRNNPARAEAETPPPYGFGWFVATKETRQSMNMQTVSRANARSPRQSSRNTRIANEKTIQVVYHGGDWPGFHSYMLYGRIDEPGKPTCELTLVLLSNFEPAEHDRVQNRLCHLARELSRLFWGDDKDVNILLDDAQIFCLTKPNPKCPKDLASCDKSVH